MRHTCPQLAGFFGSDFWETLVLRAAHHEPAVRHGLIALGSLHEHQALRPGDHATFALEQYNFAIRGLLSPSSENGRPSADICLITCVLFICFEVRA